ncbi:MAG: peptide deformylase [Thermodesulfobacteriota bacterium]
MPVLSIVTYPAPILLAKADPVADITAETDALISDMAETMYAAPGLGLAAVQVGVGQRIIVYDVKCDDEDTEKKLCTLVNPRIVNAEGELLSENEGCLSVPEYRSDVKRFARVTVEGVDRTGKPVRLDAEGLLAIVLQHEIDHLEGKLFIDRISRLKRDLYKRRVKKVLKEGA